MFSFFKRKSDYGEVPEWASFFDSKQFAVFVKELDRYFKKLNINYDLEYGYINVKQNEFGFDKHGLTNIAQVCKQMNTRRYYEIISQHFDAMIRSSKFDKDFQAIISNFEEVRKYISVRLYDNDYVNSVGKENTIGKDFAGDIYSMIVFDLPDSVLSITPDQAEPWNKTVEELFTIGVSNIRQKYPVTISKEDFNDFSIWFAQSDHFYTPNIVFDIENRPELIGSKGSLIGLPHRHAAIIYPIEGLEILKAINGLIPTIHGMNLEGPGSLSNNLFWYKDKVFTQLPYRLEEKKLQFIPPDNFLDMLNGLE